MNATHPTPAARFIARYGVQRLSKWSRRDRSRIHAWTWPKSRGGTGGVIPHAVRDPIISGARDDLNEEIAFSDFEPREGESYLSECGASPEPRP